MTLDEIKNGESKNIEFKVQLPDDSKKYMKCTADCSGYYFSDHRREMHRSNRNISGAEQAVLYQEPWEGEGGIHSSGGNQQTGR